jgi:hypothetical protein
MSIADNARWPEVPYTRRDKQHLVESLTRWPGNEVKTG